MSNVLDNDVVTAKYVTAIACAPGLTLFLTKRDAGPRQRKDRRLLLELADVVEVRIRIEEGTLSPPAVAC